MASPLRDSEIVVSTQPPPLLPPTPKMNEEPGIPELEQHPIDQPPSTAGDGDAMSKKSFKRKYRKLLNKYLKIRATNINLHTAYAKALTLSSQLSNESANLLDILVDLNSTIPPTSPPLFDEDAELPPSPSTYNFDAHYGYSPTPSPPPEVANQLTQPQIAMGMYKLEPGTGGGSTGLGLGIGTGTMGPPMPVPREDSVDTFTKARTVVPRRSSAALPAATSRKRKDRDSEGEENAGGTLGRKKTRG